jgi:hypothetical protein
MDDERSIYLLTVRAEPGVDAIRALRAWLKVGLRSFGLRCVGITPNEEEMTMDARKYASKHVKPDNVRDGPIQTRIINVYEDERYGNLMLELETGSTFRLNEGNTNVLINAWGVETNDWLTQEIELSLGTYKDWRADPVVDKETVKVRAISPAKTAAGNSGAPSKPPLPPSKIVATRKDDMDDSIPF